MTNRLDKILLIVTLITIYVVCHCIIFPALKKIHQERSHVASQEIKNKMAHHGTGMCYEERGKFYFVNKKGQRCRL
jgi:hypothetical protein